MAAVAVGSGDIETIISSQEEMATIGISALMVPGLLLEVQCTASTA
jgi:hypothetical protein